MRTFDELVSLAMIACSATVAAGGVAGCNKPSPAVEGPASASPPPTAYTPPPPPRPLGASKPSAPPAARAVFTGSVVVHLERIADGGKAVSFGVPLPRAVRVDPKAVRVRVKGAPANVEGLRVSPILFDYDELGNPAGPRALLVQLPAAVMNKPAIDVDVIWSGAGAGAPSEAASPYAQVKFASPENVELAERAIEKDKHPIAPYRLVVKKGYTKTLFTGWEPTVLATFPSSYLTDTHVFNGLLSREDLDANASLKGLTYLSDNLGPFVDAAFGREGYPLKPESVPDPVTNYEGWLYDRCATFLLAYAHLSAPHHLRGALRSCSYYGSKIETSGARAGIFSGKPDPDTKYSHVRGLYMYYALTGDEAAKAAAKAIADMWLSEQTFALPYRKGAVRAADKLWTERLLAVDMEAMIYGFLLFGDARYLTAFREFFETAYRHVTTKNQAELNAITKVRFPPQNCFIHSAEQHSEGDATDPWCSGWMAEMLVDPLLRYQELTGDPRVDEIFVRLTRSLRDAGAEYVVEGEPKGDPFLDPHACFEADADFDDARLVAPAYGFGIAPNGKRRTFAEGSDVEHCADATALTAAGIRALKRQRAFDGPGVGPFKTEGESFVGLHHELSYCAKRAFGHYTRPMRDPRKWKSDDLADGYARGDDKAQATWLERQSLGHPVHVSVPSRRLSWWFNGSLAQFRMIEEAGVAFPSVRGGVIQCKGRKAKPL